ncbi:MAG: ribonuclease HI [Spirochaetaceae bacterium]|nr:MAG: ribonuclease HI [Spirochaetaceae bacterium]
MSDDVLNIFTDGGCHGNPGPGGWAYVIVENDRTFEQYGHASNTTNNRMELLAVINALLAAKERINDGGAAAVHTDSQYVRNGITQWIHNWIRNGWKTAAKKPVKNQDLWQELYRVEQEMTVEWHWLKGHAGHTWNERCDALVQQAISELDL